MIKKKKTQFYLVEHIINIKSIFDLYPVRKFNIKIETKCEIVNKFQEKKMRYKKD